MIVEYVLIGFALSFDAFFTCIALSTKKEEFRKFVVMTPITIGIMHILFPIISFNIIKYTKDLLNFSTVDSYTTYIGAFIFIAMGLFIISKKEEKQNFVFTYAGILILCFSVSIDSLLIGISYGFTSGVNIYISACIFAVITFLVSILAIFIGRKISDKIRNFDYDLISGLIFIFLGFTSLFDLF